MSSLREMLLDLESKSLKSEKPQQNENAQVKNDEHPIGENLKKNNLSNKVSSKVREISEDLDNDKLQLTINTINKFIYSLIVYPVTLIDRMLLVLNCSNTKKIIFRKTKYVFSGVLVALLALYSYLENSWEVLVGALLGVILFEIINRRLTK